MLYNVIMFLLFVKVRIYDIASLHKERKRRNYGDVNLSYNILQYYILLCSAKDRSHICNIIEKRTLSTL